LGIIFIGKISPSVFEKLKSQIELVFDSYFFDISFIGQKKLDTSLHELHTKVEFNLLDRTLSKVILYPTNKFYSIIKTHMSEKNIGFGLGLTNLPIYSSSDEKLLFLFGEANLNHNCAIISTHNLLDIHKYETTENRIIKETIHEVGHLVLGLEHCPNNKCVMWFSRNITEIDSKSNGLCEKCNAEFEYNRTINNF
jgi:archaemetzincin